ncbi:MAG: AAA family ATPase [Thaumarchaeota archaeon]|nr:AAA family ATPase [Nitrososphaerota archaeon]
MWSEKHRPKSLDTMVGNEQARVKLLLWLKKWKPGVKAALLVGPPGTGKTTTVHLAADELGLRLVELNASDTRTKDRLSKRIGEVISSTSLFGERSLIFLDEVDGLAGRSDYGAIDFIKDAVKRSENPIVMAANDPESDEVRKLASATSRIEFQKPELEAVVGHLRKIADEEKLPMGGKELESIARAANGDIRSAINFLQTGMAGTKDEELTASQSVNAFFRATDEKAALKALRSYGGQPREKVRDLFNGVVKAKVHQERKAEALEVLSRADVLMGRIMRGKDWRLLRYLDPMLAADLWSALGDGGGAFTMDAVPWLLQVRIWNDSKKLKDIGLAAGRRTGTSQRGFLVGDMPYLLLLCRGEAFREAFVKSLNLEENYAAFIEKESARKGGR